MEYTGITIDDIHTFDDWGLRLVSMSIPMPEVKTNYINLPGTDMDIDLTEALTGMVTYKAREGVEFVFDGAGAYDSWHILTSRIANFVHGRKRKIMVDSDPDHYYVGRLSVDSQKTNEITHRIVISGYMDTYKYDSISAADDWLWDTFSFETGVIREYKDLVVSGTRQVTVIGSPMPVVPVFIASGPMTVEYDGKTYYLAAGRNKVYDIYIKNGEHVLTFKGQGTVSIEYRGGSL